MEIVKWANAVFDEIFDSNEYDFLKYRLANDILIELKDMEEDVEDVSNLTEDENVYVIGMFNRFWSQLKGDTNYIETYKVVLSADDFENDLKELIKESFGLLSKEHVLSSALVDSFKNRISKNSCLTKKDVLILEIMNSMLLINESYKSKNKDVFIGTLGKSVESHKLNDEMTYLKRLYSAFKGECEFRFSLSLKANNILYTNIYFIN
ncbi:hypothetical protein JYG23_04395 [Sedimentibacter sp. zth1]|uniref:hypothetical protein n=1 Tax=Sedimentibacter sp. zth1 TaxID=2816908 RepID=UPI001A9298AD|nr:hypothetical protein [Sedimentibacter sp. zth1]QSX06699.1 hypothetical protein JYG23_04395 [Sedimentibacter sp. zth1]